MRISVKRAIFVKKLNFYGFIFNILNKSGYIIVAAVAKFNCHNILFLKGIA